MFVANMTKLTSIWSYLFWIRLKNCFFGHPWSKERQMDGFSMIFWGGQAKPAVFGGF